MSDCSTCQACGKCASCGYCDCTRARRAADLVQTQLVKLGAGVQLDERAPMWWRLEVLALLGDLQAHPAPDPLGQRAYVVDRLRAIAAGRGR